jgi:hypothetical protein
MHGVPNASTVMLQRPLSRHSEVRNSEAQAGEHGSELLPLKSLRPFESPVLPPSHVPVSVLRSSTTGFDISVLLLPRAGNRITADAWGDARHTVRMTEKHAAMWCRIPGPARDHRPHDEVTRDATNFVCLAPRPTTRTHARRFLAHPPATSAARTATHRTRVLSSLYGRKPGGGANRAENATRARRFESATSAIAPGAQQAGRSARSGYCIWMGRSQTPAPESHTDTTGAQRRTRNLRRAACARVKLGSTVVVVSRPVQ